MLEQGYKQQQSDAERLGFATEAFRALRDVSPYDLRIGAGFGGDRARALAVALRDARNTIRTMPAHYTTFPNSEDFVFPCSPKQVRESSAPIRLDVDFLARYGTFSVPRNLWDAMTHYACWIEPAVLNEWCALMAKYDAIRTERRQPLEALSSDCLVP